MKRSLFRYRAVSGFVRWVWRQLRDCSLACVYPTAARMQLHHAAHCAHMVTADKAASDSLPLFPYMHDRRGIITPVRLWLLNISSDLTQIIPLTPSAAAAAQCYCYINTQATDLWNSVQTIDSGFLNLALSADLVTFFLCFYVCLSHPLPSFFGDCHIPV